MVDCPDNGPYPWETKVHVIEEVRVWRCSCGFETDIAMRIARHRKEHNAK